MKEAMLFKARACSTRSLLLGVTAIWLLCNLAAAVVQMNNLPYGEPCKDHTGAIRNHLDTWSTSACDKFTCIIRLSGNYTLQQVCRAITPPELPDSVNCQVVSNSSATYPGCCPELYCATISPSTTAAPLCADRSPATACNIWMTYFAGCNNVTATPRIFNFTSVFCRKTCQFC